MEQNADALVTAADIAALLGSRGVTPATVYLWTSRKKIQSRGKVGRSHLYRWGDVVIVERETRANRQSPRHDARLLAA